MKRSSRVLLLLVLLAAIATTASLAFDARAQTSGDAAAATTEVEAEALRLYRENKLVSARTKAEEAIRANHNSIVGHFVLGCVLHEAEGSAARGMFHLGRAREIYETTWAASSRPAGAPWELHREILYKVQALAGEMEMHEYRLHVLGYHDYLYDPDLLGETAWTLMSLERFDEARQYANQAIAGSDPWQKTSGRNALCAIEGEARTREPYYLACKAALEAARAEQGSEESNGIAVDAYNASLAAMAALRFDEAEQFALEGSRRLEFTIANPWRLLTWMYLEQGRMPEAIEALRNMQSWRKRQPAHLRDHDRAETDLAFATVMLVAGETELGMTAVDRAIDQPDRRGLTSSTPEQALGGTALLRRALRRAHAARVAEMASVSGTWPRIEGTARAASMPLESWPDEERIISVLAGEDRLVSTIRLYARGGIEPLPVWLVGDLVEILGAGVVSVALDDARRMEAQTPALTPFYDAIEAEVELARGNEGRAYTIAQQALATLPENQRLLRARVLAVAAEAARQDGKDTIANGLYEQAMQLDPSVIRRLGIVLTATITASGGPVADRAAELLERSPRFSSGGIFGGSRGFSIAVTQAGEGARACLRSAQGNQLSCAEAVPLEDEAPMDMAARLAYELHDAAFSAPLPIDASVLSGLDGRTTTSQEVARERLHDLLDDVTGNQPQN